MRSRTTRRFRKTYARLPEHIKQRAREAYRQFADNPHHPGLRFKQIHAAQSIYSVRASKDYRALGIVEGSTITWFWIGSHAEYDDLVSRL